MSRAIEGIGSGRNRGGKNKTTNASRASGLEQAFGSHDVFVIGFRAIGISSMGEMDDGIDRRMLVAVEQAFYGDSVAEAPGKGAKGACL